GRGGWPPDRGGAAPHARVGDRLADLPSRAARAPRGRRTEDGLAAGRDRRPPTSRRRPPRAAGRARTGSRRGDRGPPVRGPPHLAPTMEPVAAHRADPQVRPGRERSTGEAPGVRVTNRKTPGRTDARLRSP